jgi:hypothetical protein
MCWHCWTALSPGMKQCKFRVGFSGTYCLNFHGRSVNQLAYTFSCFFHSRSLQPLIEGPYSGRSELLAHPASLWALLQAYVWFTVCVRSSCCLLLKSCWLLLGLHCDFETGGSTFRQNIWNSAGLHDMASRKNILLTITVVRTWNPVMPLLLLCLVIICISSFAIVSL